MEEVLKVDKIRKTYTLSRRQQKISNTDKKKIVAVDGISFSVGRGEIFGLLGPNGAGKTTTLRMVSSLIKPESGNIYIEGKDAVKDSNFARSKIGFLTSELKLEECFTPNFIFRYFAEMRHMNPDEIEKNKQYYFEKFGIDKYAEVKIGNLSTGMKQKVVLVTAVLHNPDIVIFDEPTNGLDVLTSKVVTDFLLELKKQEKCIIISTHIFELVEKLCDRVGIIFNGKMILSDDLESLTKEKSLEDAFFDIYKKHEIKD